MQQLLTLTAQSEQFLKASGDVRLEPSSASQSKGGDFARELLAGLELNKSNDSEITQQQLKVSQTTAQLRLKESDGKALQRFQFDDSDVGEPVEAPILEMLEEMQTLLQPGGEASDSQGDAAQLTALSDLDDEEMAAQLAKLSELLAELGAESLSDEQRQQLAGEVFATLSEDEQRQIMQLSVADVAAQESVKGSVDAELLSRLSRLSELADAAVKVAGGEIVAKEPSLSENAQRSDDAKALQWLTQQLQELERGAKAESSAATGDDDARQAVLQQLQQLLDDDRSLSTEQKQQVQQLLNQVEQQLMQPSQTAAATTSQPAALSELQKLLAQVTDNDAPAERTERAQPVLNASAKATETTTKTSDPKAAVDDKPVDVASNKPSTEKSADVKPDNALMNGVAERAAPSRTEAPTSFGEELINQQTAAVSTQTGTVKATEMSSTLQSSMQSIQKPFDPQQSEASQKLQERINIMLSKNIQRADIRLDPPELGQLQVRINMNSEQATVQFQVQSPQAREAIENALPRLREMLEQQGVALADTDVKEQQQQTAGQQESSQRDGGMGGRAEMVEEHEIALDNGRPIGLGGVDFYV
jgi:flagellar hook-length control protein FliK